MRRSSSKSRMESADTPLLAESSCGVIPRSSRIRLSRCSRGMGVPYPAIRPAEREPSGRTDKPVRAGPETAAVFRGASLTSISVSSEGETIHEKEQSMSTETKDRKETGEGLEFGYTINGADGSSTVHDPGYCGAR